MRLQSCLVGLLRLQITVVLVKAVIQLLKLVLHWGVVSVPCSLDGDVAVPTIYLSRWVDTVPCVMVTNGGAESAGKLHKRIIRWWEDVVSALLWKSGR